MSVCVVPLIWIWGCAIGERRCKVRVRTDYSTRPFVRSTLSSVTIYPCSFPYAKGLSKVVHVPLPRELSRDLDLREGKTLCEG